MEKRDVSRRFVPLVALLALALPVATFALDSPAKHGGGAPVPASVRPLAWTPAPWSPPGFEKLDRLLREGHEYPAMGWL